MTSPPPATGDVRRTLPRGRHSLGRTAVVVSQRARLIEAIVEAVAEKGYAATTVADVIGRAGVSRTTFYDLFADKEDCFLTAYEAGARAHIDAVRTAADAAEGWLEKLRAGGLRYLEVLAEEPAWARAFIVEVLSAGQRALRHRAAVHARSVALLREGHERARAALGDLPPLRDEVFEAVVGAVNELVFLRISRGETASLPELAPVCLHISLSLYGLDEGSFSAAG